MPNSCDEIPQAPVPVRRIGTNRRSVTGVYVFKGRTPIEYESTLERDFLIRAEFSLSVLDVVQQPCEIPFQAPNGRSYGYVPDFLVQYRLADCHVDYAPQPLLVEVKPRAEWKAHWRQWSAKWKAASRFAAERGWRFRIYDEGRIRDVRLANIRFLERFGRLGVDRNACELVIRAVAERGSVQAADAAAVGAEGTVGAQATALVWHLVATRQLDCDLSLPLGPQTEIWVVGHDQ